MWPLTQVIVRQKDLLPPAEQLKRDRLWMYPGAKWGDCQRTHPYHQWWGFKDGARALFLQEMHQAVGRFAWGLAEGQVLAFVGGGNTQTATVVAGTHLSFQMLPQGHPLRRPGVPVADLSRVLTEAICVAEGERIVDRCRVRVAQLLLSLVPAPAVVPTFFFVADSADTDAFLAGGIVATDALASLSTPQVAINVVNCPRMRDCAEELCGGGDRVLVDMSTWRRWTEQARALGPEGRTAGLHFMCIAMAYCSCVNDYLEKIPGVGAKHFWAAMQSRAFRGGQPAVEKTAGRWAIAPAGWLQ